MFGAEISFDELFMECSFRGRVFRRGIFDGGELSDRRVYLLMNNTGFVPSYSVTPPNYLAFLYGSGVIHCNGVKGQTTVQGYVQASTIFIHPTMRFPLTASTE